MKRLMADDSPASQFMDAEGDHFNVYGPTMQVAVNTELEIWKQSEIDKLNALLDRFGQGDALKHFYRYSAGKRSAAQRSAAQRSAAQRSAAQRNATQRNATQRNATQRNATQRNATQRNATQRNATQRNATQRNATQRNATQRNATQQYFIITRREIPKKLTIVIQVKYMM